MELAVDAADNRLTMTRISLLPLGLLLLCCGLAQASWLDRLAAHGVVIEKIFRPAPFSKSLGEEQEGIYKLELRDEKNRIRSQMVSRETFFAYEIGDQFDGTISLQAQRAFKEARKASLALSLPDPPSPAMGPSPRLVSIYFTQDMLPETEAF